jgi:hypothetical protein
MRRLILAGVLVAGVACAPMVFADEYASGGEHHFVKDSVITTKVKSKLAAKAFDHPDQDQSGYRCEWRGLVERASPHQGCGRHGRHDRQGHRGCEISP